MKQREEFLEKAQGKFLQEELLKHKELGVLCELIEDSEAIVCVSRAFMENDLYAIAITEKRIVMVSCSFGKRYRFFEFPLSGITRILAESGLLFGSMRIQLGAEYMIWKSIPKECILEMKRAMGKHFSA